MYKHTTPFDFEFWPRPLNTPAPLITDKIHSPNAPPSSERHDAMVNHMECAEVAPFFPQHEEEGVEVVDELWEEVPPGHVGGQHAFLGVGVVDGLAEPVVAAGQPEVAGFLENPQAEKGLEEVVGDHELLDVVGRSVLHEGRACVADDVVVDGAEGQHRPRGGHEQPVVHPEKRNNYLMQCVLILMVMDL